MTSIVLIIAVNWLPVHLTNQSKAMTTFNEIKLIVITYHMMLFTDFVGDVDTEYKIGYSCIVFLFFGTAINMSSLVVDPIKLSHHKTRLYCYKRKARVYKKNRWG